MVAGKNVPTDGIQVPERFIPFPRSISPEARTNLAALVAQRPPVVEVEPSLPADPAEWADLVGLVDAGIVAMFVASRGTPKATTETLDIEGLTIYRSTPAEIDPLHAPFAFLDIHGGAFTGSVPNLVRGMGRSAWCSEFFRGLPHAARACLPSPTR